MSYCDMCDRLVSIAQDLSCIVDMCKSKGDTNSPVYQRAEEALEKVDRFLDALEND